VEENADQGWPVVAFMVSAIFIVTLLVTLKALI
jgi:hypothetical protein